MPFLALRSYLPADHPDKHKEIGSEPTPADFLDTLLDLTVEWRRVLTPHGSLCVELGDTYAGSGGAGGDYAEGGMRDGQPMFRAGYVRNDRPNRPAQESPKAYGNGGPRPARVNRGDWPLDKSLCGIPELYRLSLAYGRSILRPERLIEPWRIRNVIRWCRPNPPVGALGDKFRPGTSDMVVACTSRDRWFDLDAVREPHKGDHRDGEAIGNNKGGENGYSGFGRDVKTRVHHPAGAPPLDWWQVSTEPYAGSHYATWPRALLTRPIQAMCPRQVCVVCGEPRRRIVEDSAEYAAHKADAVADYGDERWSWTDTTTKANRRQGVAAQSVTAQRTTLGWSDCGHNTWRNGIVLDPFAGSGTTLAVATGHGRDAIGIDIDSRNVALARDRIGMFLHECSADELREVLNARPETDPTRDPLLAEGREGAA